MKPYSEELIEKLRNVWYDGIPASVLLLCRSLSDGHCYDRAILMSTAFLDEPGDVSMVYAAVADLKFNPHYIRKGSNPEHCYVDRITEDGKHFIYDTSMGFVYKRWIYRLIYHPKIRLVKEKTKIAEFVEKEGVFKNEAKYMDSHFILHLVIPSIEANYGKHSEMYAACGILQREVELFKKIMISRLQEAQI